MRRNPGRIGVGLWLAMLLCCGRSLAAEQVIWAQTVDEAWSLAQEHDRPMLVFITRSGCKYCTQMKGVSFANERVAHAVNHRYVPVMVNPQSGQALIQELKIRSYPTTLVISPDQLLIDQITGYLPPAELQRRLSQAAEEVAARLDRQLR